MTAELRNKIHEMFCELFANEMVTKWVLALETIDEDNDRALYVMSSPDAKPWDTLGLASYLNSIENAHITLRELNAE